MAIPGNLQIQFLQKAKDSLESGLSFADELADLLSVSKDSAYRRMRGETLLTMDEIKKVSSRFSISLDALLGVSQNSVLFNHRVIENNNFQFRDYLESICQNLQMLNAFDVKRLIYAAKDIPMFHYFPFQKLAAFKLFFWMKTILQHPDFKDRNFELNAIPQELLNVGLEIWKEYTKVPSVEIWSYETFNITLRQLQYYFESGLVNDTALLYEVLDEVEMMLSQIQRCAEAGKKMTQKNPEACDGASFELYYNEIAISDNTIFFKMGESYVTYLTHNMLNILSTTNQFFGEQTSGYLDNILSKSVLLSKVSEKERNKFFNAMKRKLETFRLELATNRH